MRHAETAQKGLRTACNHDSLLDDSARAEYTGLHNKTAGNATVVRRASYVLRA